MLLLGIRGNSNDTQTVSCVDEFLCSLQINEKREVDGSARILTPVSLIYYYERIKRVLHVHRMSTTL